MLTQKLYNWNGTLGNKYINNFAFWILSWVGVYGAAVSIDYIFLNTVEFWTGSNPVAMAPGETEVQYATVDGHQFRMTAQQNYFSVEELTANGYEMRNEFRFNKDANELSISNGSETQVVAMN